MKFTRLNHIKQRGLTLIEVMVALAIGGLVIAGALALYNSASSSQVANQLNSAISALRASTKSLYATTGGYGAASLNSTLISANKVPSTLYTSGGTSITHQLNGAVAVTGATTTFTIQLDNIPTDVCVSLATAATGYSSVSIAGNTINTFPISPSTAASNVNCSKTPTVIMVFTAS
jgi:prepilin-type N-terminal cleavage/methylation domain-containing protein